MGAYQLEMLFVKPNSTFPAENINTHFTNYVNYVQSTSEPFVIGKLFNSRDGGEIYFFSDKTRDAHGMSVSFIELDSSGECTCECPIPITEIENDDDIDVNYPPDGDSILINGSLESNVPSNSWSGKAIVEGWFNDNGGVEGWGSPFLGVVADDGNTFVELDATNKPPVDNLYQDIQTVNQQKYKLIFSTRQRGDLRDSIEIYWDGGLVDVVTPNFNDKWEVFSFIVMGDGDISRLEFRELADENTSYGPLLDNIKLLPTYSMVDEPDEYFGGDDDDVCEDRRKFRRRPKFYKIRANNVIANIRRKFGEELFFELVNTEPAAILRIASGEDIKCVLMDYDDSLIELLDS